MLAARRAVALTIAAIAAVAVAAASAGPIYLGAAGAAARQAELAVAPAAERVITQTWPVDHAGVPVTVRLSERREPPTVSGFDAVPGFQISGAVTDPEPIQVWLVQRGGVCAQVVLVAGRCVSGAWEVMVSERAAAGMGLRVGRVLTFAPEVAGTSGPVAADGSTRLSVVGVYAPRDPTAAYWADREYVSGGDLAGGREVLFATGETAAWLPYADALEIMDLVPHPDAFADSDRLRSVAAGARLDGLDTDTTAASGIPVLLDRIDASRRALTEGVGLAVVPLVLLCWLVLYLAVTNSAFRRRSEAGLSGLRGVPAGTRWWLGVAEYLVPILLGAPLGLLGGYLAVLGVARWLLPVAGGVTVTPLALAFAVAAVLGAVGIGVVAHWRATAVPVVTLLRRVPGRRLTARPGAAELVAVTLAAAATYQVTSGGAQAGGLALLAPMFLALAIGLVAARLAALGAVRLARRGLRRGSLGRALAGTLMARQPGQARLLAMFVVLFGLLGFAVTAADVAARARAARVTAELGAARVLDVQAVPARRLLAAVRAADPAGRYAMAVARLPGDGPPTLAVDSSRLGVASWSDPSLPPARAAALLRPTRPDPVRFAGTGIDLRMTVTGRQPEGIRLVVRLQPEGDAGPVDIPVQVRPGRAAYRLFTPCDGGCRLLGLQLTGSDQEWYDAVLTIGAMHQTGPDAPVLDAAGLADESRWNLAGSGSGTGEMEVGRGATGVRLGYSGNVGPQGTLQPVSTPRPVPLIASGGPPPVLAVSGVAAPWETVGRVRLVTGAGPRGALVDLEYADLAGYLQGLARRPQVWLAGDAPADAPDRLREAGLTVLGDRTLAAERDRQERHGPALALRFYLVVAVAAVALGLGGVAVVASTERAGLAAQLRALRVQGVPAGIVWRVGFGGHAALTALAAVVGAATAGLAWWVARATLPLFSDGGEEYYAPAWPRPAVVAAAVLAALLVLTAAGAAATLGLRRAVERSDG
jgi:hypothetical protein